MFRLYLVFIDWYSLHFIRLSTYNFLITLNGNYNISTQKILIKKASSINDSTYAWRDNIYSGKQAQTALFKDPVRTAL
jgi:hypothetical protein